MRKKPNRLKARGRARARLFFEQAAIHKSVYAHGEAIAAWREGLRLDGDQTWRWIDLGDEHVTSGNLADALAAFRNGVAAAERAGDERDISVCQSRTGNVLQAQGKLDAALDAYQLGMAIAQRLAAQDPDNAEWLRDHSISHEKIGDVLQAQGKLDAALEAYKASMAIRERLAAQDPGNAQWQRDLSISHEKIGDILQAQGKLDAALDAYKANMVIAQRLAAQDPGNAQWQRDHSVSHNRIGDVLGAQGKLDAALDAYRASMAIRQRLAAQDPGNAEWQRDLIISHVKIAAWDPAIAAMHYAAALEIAKAMQAKGILAPRDGWMIEELQKRLAAAGG